MYVCMYVRACVYICVWLWVDHCYVYIYAYICVCPYVECVWSRVYFVREPLIQLCKFKWSDKMGPWLKRASILSSHFLWWSGDVESGCIFKSSLWVAENPEVGNVHLCINTNKVFRLDREGQRESAGQREPERVG